MFVSYRNVVCNFIEFSFVSVSLLFRIDLCRYLCFYVCGKEGERERGRWNKKRGRQRYRERDFGEKVRAGEGGRRRERERENRADKFERDVEEWGVMIY